MTDMHGLKPNVWPNTPYNVTAQIRGDIREIVQREIEQVTIEAIGAETPAGAQAKVDASALSLTAAIAAAKAELALVDDTKAPLMHTHDDRYYLKAQVDTTLSNKAALVHTHHDLYYQKSEIDGLLTGTGAIHDHNDLYYLKSEINTFLDAKAPAVHNHDDRYYTEAQTNALLSTKASTSHTHDDRYFTEAEVTAALAGKAPLIHDHDDRYYTKSGVDALLAGLPSGDGGVTDHGALNGLLDDDHTQYALADGSRGAFAPPLGADDNYVTDAEKAALHSHANKTALDQVSGINTGDQDLSGYAQKSANLSDLADAPTARTNLGLGTAATAETTDFAPATGQFPLHTVTPAATVTLSADHPAQSLGMDQDTTIQWPSIAAGQAVLLWLTGAYTPTWDITGLLWAGGTAPTYASGGTLYHLVDMGAAGVMGSGQAYS